MKIIWIKPVIKNIKNCIIIDVILMIDAMILIIVINPISELVLIKFIAMQSDMMMIIMHIICVIGIMAALFYG